MILVHKAPSLEELWEIIKKRFPTSTFLDIKNFEAFKKRIVKNPRTTFLAFQKRILLKWQVPHNQIALLIKQKFTSKVKFEDLAYDEDTQI